MPRKCAMLLKEPPSFFIVDGAKLFFNFLAHCDLDIGWKCPVDVAIMPQWYWEKKDLRSTPSQQAGLPHDTEMRYRREGAKFIMELGKALNLSHLTMATATVYFHRFYMFHTFQDFPKYVVATCCLFLAGKAEETPKKCKDLIRTVRALTNDKQFETFGVDPREEIMVTERVLLQTIKFDLQVEHPYASMIKYAKCLKGDPAKLQKMVQTTWTFINDSYCTTLCLQWEPEIIAIALIYLGAKLSKFEVKDWNNRRECHKNWWDQFVEDLDIETLDDLCHSLLDLYQVQAPLTRDQPESPRPSAHPKPALSHPHPESTSKPSKIRRSSPPPPPPPIKSRPHTPPMPPNPSVPPLPAASALPPYQLPPSYATVAALPPPPPPSAPPRGGSTAGYPVAPQAAYYPPLGSSAPPPPPPPHAYSMGGPPLPSHAAPPQGFGYPPNHHQGGYPPPPPSHSRQYRRGGSHHARY